jgi:hypothetical protein
LDFSTTYRVEPASGCEKIMNILYWAVVSALPTERYVVRFVDDAGREWERSENGALTQPAGRRRSRTSARATGPGLPHRRRAATSLANRNR